MGSIEIKAFGLRAVDFEEVGTGSYRKQERERAGYRQGNGTGSCGYSDQPSNERSEALNKMLFDYLEYQRTTGNKKFKIPVFEKVHRKPVIFKSSFEKLTGLFFKIVNF